MWHLKVVYVVDGALGLIHKGTQEQVNKTPGALSFLEIQKYF